MLDVYKTRYKLNGDPFRLSPDHHFSFAHSSYATAEAYLKYAISQGEGIIAITGGPGAGKTTLVNGLLAELDKTSIQVAALSNVQLNPGNLVRMVVEAFGLHIDDAKNANPVSELEQFLKQQCQKGCRAVLIIDEAQGLSPDSLEVVRLLSNMQHDNRLLLHVVLVGQEKLLDMIHAPGMEHLQQRIIAASHLEPLDLDETVAYVEHRLSHVGWQGEPAISEDTSRLIHKFSGGVPRRINLICHRLFLYGGLKQKHELVGEDVRHVIDELYKERLLAPEVLGEQSLEESAVAETENACLPAFSALRAEDIMHTKIPRQRSALAASQAPKADDVIPLTRPIPHSPQHKGNESSLPPLNERNRELRTTDEPTSKLLPVEPVASGTESEKRKRWRLAAVYGLLAGLVLVLIVKMNVGNQPADLRLSAPAGTDSNIARVESVHEKKNTVDTDSLLTSVANSPDPSLLTEITTMSTSQRDSAFSNSSADLDSVPLSDTEQIDTIKRGSATTEESLNAIARKPLKQDTAGKLVEQREAEHLKQELQVVEKNLTEPPALAGSKQKKQRRNRQLEVADEKRRKQHEVHSSKINLERKEQPQKTRREAGLANLNKASTDIGWTEESDGESEHKDIQLPTHSRVTDNKTRPEGMSQTRVGAAQERPIKTAPAATAVAKASQQAAEPTVTRKDRLKSLLLAGRWNSDGKPAVLLLSEITHCEAREKNIKCWSVPQNRDTKQGLALYKVEATLQSFSRGNNFQISYRTLVKLIGDDQKADSTSKEGHWQVTEHALECRFIRSEWIQCHDEKGVTRNYQRSGLSAKPSSSL